MTETFESDPIDLSNEPVSFRFEIRSNNETVIYRPGVSEHHCGVIQHKYDGFPAQGEVRYDVLGYDVIDTDASAEEYEMYESEIAEYLDSVLWDTSLSSASANVSHAGHHKVRIENPYEGDWYVVEFDTANRRRVR